MSVRPSFQRLETSVMKNNVRKVQKKIKNKNSDIKKSLTKINKLGKIKKGTPVKQEVIQSKKDRQTGKNLMVTLRRQQNKAERLDMELIDLTDRLNKRLVLENRALKNRAELVKKTKKIKRRITTKIKPE